MNIAYNIDCMEYMKTLPDNSFDLAIVDPPYGIGVFSMTYTKEGKTRKSYGVAAAPKRDYHRVQDWDIRPSDNYFKELFRVANHQIIWGGNYFSDVLYPSHSFVVWDKRCQDNMTNSFADCEYAWMSSGMGVARVFRYLWNGMLQGDMKNKEDRFHPTQKPVALYEWLLRNYAKEGYRILDTHLGSGSSRIAAYNMGYDFVGCEIDREYFEKQEKRFAEETAQLRFI